MYRGVDCYFSRFHHSPINPTPVLIARCLGRHEFQRAIAEAGVELGAAVMWHGRDFDERFAYADAGAGGQILRCDIQVHEQAVAEEGERLAVGDEFRDVVAHHGQLGIGQAIGIAAPIIIGQAFFGGENGTLQNHPRFVGVAAHEEGDSSAFFRCNGKGQQAGFQIFECAMP